ncbi:cellulose signaling associated protein ENVOY [Ophiocordyceps camponoti-floridani]|uniref:Cellulose signaling associated protein ENVOY n=1 Tax=Ophiocordyceps camponoti-floridani TaxID=2030778 RepID=A0A8H4VGZ3_9HYPO|nr:cellulose signaling associated protein ENVOY [Ophiocordyceps camponoti-floridani]
MASEGPQPPPLNNWETRALDYRFSPAAPVDVAAVEASWCQPRRDPLIFPGLYSASGFDLMNLLLRIISRPSPQIELGAVDCSVALVVCDLDLPDAPIVYASDSFCDMTGYSTAEVLGRNCRFLQSHGHNRSRMPVATSTKVMAQQISSAVEAGREIQVTLPNYKKNGQLFNNFLSIIPVERQAGHRYAVGFQVQVD